MTPKINPATLAAIAAGASLKTEKIQSHLSDIPIARIVPNPHQPRMDIDPHELFALSESIRLHGLIQPITVIRSESGYTLVSGHTRVEAHKILGRDTIRANIIEADDDDLAMLALIENVTRSDLDPLEIALALSREPFISMRDDHIAAALGYSTTKVRNIRATLRLCERILEHYRKFKPSIGLDILSEIQKLPDPDRQWEAYDHYLCGVYTRDDIRAAVRAAKSTETAPEAPKTTSPISRSGSAYKIDCSALHTRDREKFEADLHALITKYTKG